MLTLANIRHPSMVHKINDAMIQALKNFNENFESGKMMVDVKSNKGQTVLSVFYSRLGGFFFAEEVNGSLVNIGEIVRLSLSEYVGNIRVK